MSEPTVARHQEGGVLTIRLNRPDKLNAFDLELVDGLLEALDYADGDASVRCVVIAGAGRGFSAGQDLDIFAEHYRNGERIEIARHLRRTYNVVALRLRALPKPVIAAVNGIAAGVGISLALACDIRIAAADARFTLGFSRIGLVPDGGGSFLLPLIVGLGRALELAMTSDRIDAAEALRIGLVNHVVEPDRLDDEAAALATRLVAIPASALAFTKHAFNRTTMPHFASWLHEEADIQQRASEHHDHREGVLAFLEKRSPVFRND
jgi:2-(1,2-epoxy-1,2-dihydrophenyl)acetyl-CoA isomerase